MISRVALLLGAGSVLQASSEAAAPCCQACEPGKEKYYSVPDPDEAHPECGECCLQPSRYHFWKWFEPKLLRGDCASQGFTKYKSTGTDGVGLISVTSDQYVRADAPKEKACPDKLHAVYADMHDGDKKQVILSGKALTIKPSGNNQSWAVNAEFDPISCSAVVDFNVPGKPGPPPVKLTATLWYSIAADFKKTEFEFTDQSGTLAAKGFPLNRWVDISDVIHEKSSKSCPAYLRAVFADMHDGDKKEVTISGTSLTIKPSGNNQTWVVKSALDVATCSASIDFNVPGKPSPPPVKLAATFMYTTTSAADDKTEIEFTDPSGSLAPASFPLNHWVQISREARGAAGIMI